MTIQTDTYCEVTDATNKTWKEWLSDDDIDEYSARGWIVVKIDTTETSS